MKRLFLLPILALCMIGCQKEGTGTSESNLIEVGFNSNVPSITFDDESLVGTRAYSDEPKYLIQVYLNNTPYAYGIFNDITSHKIMLEKGKTYKLKVAYFPNGHSYSFDDFRDGFTDDFVYSVSNDIFPFDGFDGRDFGYTLRIIPSIKYYADNIEYTASSNANIDIDLEAWVFGLSFKVKNLIDGTVKVAFSELNGFPSPLTFTPDKPENETIYSIPDNLDKINDLYAHIYHTSSAGIETSIYNGDIPASRLKKTIVNINLKPVSNESESSFSVDLEQYSITDGETLNLTQE